MRRLLIALTAAALLALAGCGDDNGPPPTPTAPLEGTQLVDALRDGGYVIFFRHAATTRSGQPDDDLTTCTTQRNLNAQGRREAREIGAAFRELDIPVGRVVASPYCRTKDTARLAFGHVDETSLALKDGGKPLSELIARLPEPGDTNTILVGHGLDRLPPLHLPPLDEAEAAVLVIDASGSHRVARVKADGWADLVAAEAAGS
ncbi:MAG: hypothetical protein QOD86_1368 [Miltoncostaeaceae bacterium]|jgi:hypothetical protein|nr:hypothetical protein [Miltoncostaeaceae bacterium]